MPTIAQRIESIQTLMGWDKVSPHQKDAFERWDMAADNPLWANPDRVCLYFPTGKGKTGTALGLLYIRDFTEAYVICPPSTANDWIAAGLRLGIKVMPMSHMLFRDKKTTLKRGVPIVVDEFHMLGNRGLGWKKAYAYHERKLPKGIPLIICSATPQYNDVERVFCIGTIVDAPNHPRDYETWLYDHCRLKKNPFGALPLVDRLINFDSAENFLASIPSVCYIPDDAPDILVPVVVDSHLSEEFEIYNLDHRNKKIMSSTMEKKHTRRFQQIVSEDGRITAPVQEHIAHIFRGDPDGTVMLFAMHLTVAKVLYEFLEESHPGEVAFVHGELTKKRKDQEIAKFKDGTAKFMVGTQSMSTGTDGLDKICDTMIIVDDMEDPSARRQLVGRILVRGTSGSNDNKIAHQFVYPQE